MILLNLIINCDMCWPFITLLNHVHQEITKKMKITTRKSTQDIGSKPRKKPFKGKTYKKVSLLLYNLLRKRLPRPKDQIQQPYQAPSQPPAKFSPKHLLNFDLLQLHPIILALQLLLIISASCNWYFIETLTLHMWIERERERFSRRNFDSSFLSSSF